MKKIILSIVLIANISFAFAQNINWGSIPETPTGFAYLNFGYDFGVTTQLGYAYQLETTKPIFLTADYSFPMGKTLLDDFKLRLGGQIAFYEKNNFGLSAKIYGLVRKHETQLVNLVSFGSEVSVLAGYYKPKWHVAAELGFDKSIATRTKHSDIMRENYSAIQDGWFVSSGGHFYYGIQGSKTLGERIEISLRLGATNAQGNHVDALLPFYGGIGIKCKI